VIEPRAGLTAVFAFCSCVACGRVGFDPLATKAGDAAGADTHNGDAGLPGLVLWLEMETDPPTIIDSAGGHTIACTVAGSCPQRAAGKHGSGYAFSKASSLLSLVVTYRADLDPRSGFTIAAWAQLAPAADYLCAFAEPWVSGGNPDADTFAMCVDGLGGGCAQNDVYWNANPGPQTCGPTMVDGAWHHIAFTWDGTTQHTYFDAIVNSNFPLSPPGFDAGDLLVGGDLDGSLQPAFYWSGTLDDVMWFDRALTGGEISTLAAP
jgi:hypothetical protein